MFSADLLISGGIIVTMDEQFRVIEDGGIAVRADSIVQSAEELTSKRSTMPQKSSMRAERWCSRG